MRKKCRAISQRPSTSIFGLVLAVVLQLIWIAPARATDTVPPNGAITSPSLGTVISAFTTASGTAYDPVNTDGSAGSGVASVGLEIWTETFGVKSFWNGTAWVSTLSTLPTSLTSLGGNTYSWTLTGTLPSMPNTTVYTLALKVTDNAGNTTWGSNGGTVFIGPADTTAPTISVTAPAASANITGLSSITGSAADNTGGSGLAAIDVTLSEVVSGVTKYWNGTAWTTTSYYLPYSVSGSTWTCNTSLPSGTNLPDGAYTVTAKSMDQYWNYSTAATVNFNIVPTPVAVADTYWFRSGVLTVAAPGVLANDTNNGLTLTATQTSNGTHGTAALSSNGGFTYTPGGTLATDSFTYTATDTNGIVSAPATVNLLYDNVAPTGTITSPTPNTVVSAFTTVSGTATDPVNSDGSTGSGVASVGLEFWQETYGVKQFWNGSSWVSGLVTLPTSLTSTGGNNYTWTLTGTLPTMSTTFTYYMGLVVTDEVGNVIYGSGSGTFYIGPADTTAPTVSIAAPTSAANITGLASISGTASDNTGGSGLNEINVVLSEVVGGVTKYWNGTAWTTTSYNLPYSVSGSTWTCNTSLPSGTNLPNGAYTITAHSVDQYWNVSSASTVNFNIVPAPVAVSDSYWFRSGVLTVAAPGVLANDTNNGLTLTATQTSNGTHGSASLSSNGGFTYTPGGTLATDSFTYTATDTNGNVTAPATVNLLYDNVAPTGTITTPTSGVYTSISTVSGTATDPVNSDGSAGSGVASVGVEFWQKTFGVKQFWNGTAWGPTLVGLPTSLTPTGGNNYTWTLTGTLPPLTATSTYDMALLVTDEVGNASYGSGGTSVSIGPADTTPPTVSISSPITGSDLASLTAITGLAADNTGGSGLLAINVTLSEVSGGSTLYWNGTAWTSASYDLPYSVSGATWSCSTSLPSSANLSIGTTYTVTAQSEDQFWNLSTAATATFTVVPQPIAAADSYTTTENTALPVTAPGVLGNDTGNGLTLTAQSFSTPANGALSPSSNGSFTYTPNPGFSGTDTFTYCAEDTNGTFSAPATVTITVTNPSAPSAPSAPTFTSETPSQITVQMPALPSGATSLTLEFKLTGSPTNAFVNVTDNLVGSATFTVPNLLSATSYDFEAVAVNSSGSTAGTLATEATTTSGSTPGVPGAPTLSGVTYDSVLATAPSLPANTTSLQLQSKLTSQPDSTYVAVVSGLAGAAATTVPNLVASTAYTFRYIASGSQNGTTAGTAASVTTTGAAPGWPGTPEFGNETPTSIQVLAPVLPTGATSLSLYYTNVGNSTYTLAASNLLGGTDFNVTGLTSGVNYRFYFAAVNTHGSTAGLSAIASTLASGTPPTASNTPTISFVAPTSMNPGMVIVTPSGSLPTNATNGWLLLYKLAGAPDSAYAGYNLPTYASVFSEPIGPTPTYNNYPVYGLTYDFCVVTENASGQTMGTPTQATMPTAPTVGVPAFGTCTSSSIVVIAPPLPAGASSFTLQDSTNGTTFSNCATGVAGGSDTTVSGLTASTDYYFQFVAVETGGNVTGPSAQMGTATANSQPSAPSVLGVLGNSVQVLGPPTGSDSLQYKIGSPLQSDYYYQSQNVGGIATNLGAAGALTGLQPGTNYVIRWVNGNHQANTTGLTTSVTTATLPSPAPAAPGAPTGSFTSGQISVTIPTLPSYATYLTLQYQLNGQGSFYSIPEEIFYSTTAFSFTPNPSTQYVLRWVAVGPGGQTEGPASSTITVGSGPGVPGLPTVTNVTSTSVTIVMPSLPTGATSLRLQSRSTGVITTNNPDLQFSGSALISGGATLTITTFNIGSSSYALFPSNQFAFDVEAVNDSFPSARTPAAQELFVTTLGANGDPQAPGTPEFSSITTTSVTVTMPALSSGATSLQLNQINGTGPVTVAAGANYTVTGLSSGTEYQFDVLAVNSTGSTPSALVEVDTTEGSPGAPVISNITSTSLSSTAPALPNRATGFTLEMKLSSNPDTTYEPVDTLDFAGTVTKVTGLEPNTSYTFRYVAYYLGDYTGATTTMPGATTAITTATSSFTWTPGATNFATGTTTYINCGGISWPQASATITHGTQAVLCSYLATEWEQRSDSSGAAVLFTDPCTYTWSATGGSFPNGNTGQNVAYVAPTTTGTYSVTLTVNDQNNANMATGDAGSRHDPSAPATFTVSFTVN